MNKSGIPGADWCINPYGGCSHACVYCYASFMERFRPHDTPWGTYVDIKEDIASVLAKQLRRPKQGTVMLSSVTDAWQPVEKEAQVTRACLKVLLDSDLKLSILTKSDLILRDMDLLARFKTLFGEWRVSVGFSIPVLSDRMAAVLEPGAASPSRRLDALEKLNAKGIPTWVFIAPVLPVLADDPGDIQRITELARLAGTADVVTDPLNPYPAALAGLSRAVHAHFPELEARWRAAMERLRKGRGLESP